MARRRKTPEKHNIISPYIFEKTRDGEILYDVYSRLIKDRLVFLADEIDAEVATTIAATLLYLNKESKTKPIEIYINTPGGTVHDGLFTIYDAMHYIEAPIWTVCIGEACSGGAVILSAGTPGKRLAFPNSLIMIHQMQIGDMSGSGSEIVAEAKRIEQWNERLFTTIAAHSGHTVDEIREVCERDKYFTAEEAVEFGLIDSIVPPKKQIPELKLPVPKKKK